MTESEFQHHGLLSKVQFIVPLPNLSIVVQFLYVIFCFIIKKSISLIFYFCQSIFSRFYSDFYNRACIIMEPMPPRCLLVQFKTLTDIFGNRTSIISQRNGYSNVSSHLVWFFRLKLNFRFVSSLPRFRNDIDLMYWIILFLNQCFWETSLIDLRFLYSARLKENLVKIFVKLFEKHLIYLSKTEWRFTV